MAEDNPDLESFRSKWRQELANATAPRATRTPPNQHEHSSPSMFSKKPPGPHSAANRREEDEEDVEPVPQHNITAGSSSPGLQSSLAQDDFIGSWKGREPSSALEHYEKAVEKESQGSLGDSITHYRKAYRLDPKIDKTYKNKHFPPSSLPVNPNPSNASVTVPNTAHHSLEGRRPDLVEQLAGLSIIGSPPPAEGSPAPPCPISTLPSEVLMDILTAVAATDVAAYVRLAQVCKFLAHLVLSEEKTWKQICMSKEFGFQNMHPEFVCTVEGYPNNVLEPRPYRLFVPRVSWKELWYEQPRVRFTGVYISTVNYTRPGGSSASQVTWNTPVLIVTYYRYLRFFRDGTCISLLTTCEPSEIVNHLTKENLIYNKGDNDSRAQATHPITKSALRGRWYLSSPDSSEGPGELHVETEFVDPKYTYSMHLSVRSVRTPGHKGPRNTKLVWRGFWSYNRLTDDWGEFGLRNDRAFFFSSVRSYGMGQ